MNYCKKVFLILLLMCVLQQVADMGSSISSIQQQMQTVTTQLSALQAGLQVSHLSNNALTLRPSIFSQYHLFFLFITNWANLVSGTWCIHMVNKFSSIF